MRLVDEEALLEYDQVALKADDYSVYDDEKIKYLNHRSNQVRTYVTYEYVGKEGENNVFATITVKLTETKQQGLQINYYSESKTDDRIPGRSFFEINNFVKRLAGSLGVKEEVII
jgi:hypothetical protein